MSLFASKTPIPQGKHRKPTEFVQTSIVFAAMIFGHAIAQRRLSRFEGKLDATNKDLVFDASERDDGHAFYFLHEKEAVRLQEANG